MNRKDIYVGMWGFVTGDHMIARYMWKRNFPNDWFGRVIEINKKGILFRCYRNRQKGEKRHPHLLAHSDFVVKYRN